MNKKNNMFLFCFDFIMIFFTIFICGYLIFIEENILISVLSLILCIILSVFVNIATLNKTLNIIKLYKIEKNNMDNLIKNIKKSKKSKKTKKGFKLKIGLSIINLLLYILISYLLGCYQDFFKNASFYLGYNSLDSIYYIGVLIILFVFILIELLIIDPKLFKKNIKNKTISNKKYRKYKKIYLIFIVIINLLLIMCFFEFRYYKLINSNISDISYTRHDWRSTSDEGGYADKECIYYYREFVSYNYNEKNYSNFLIEHAERIYRLRTESCLSGHSGFDSFYNDKICKNRYILVNKKNPNKIKIFKFYKIPSILIFDIILMLSFFKFIFKYRRK